MTRVIRQAEGHDCPRQHATAAILGLLAAFFMAVPALAETSSLDHWPTRQWKTSTPEAQGLDGDRLHELVDLIAENEQFPDLHSLLVVRNGYLVVEEYFAGQDADMLHTLQSVTKSFTSAAIGIAIEKGYIENVQEPVLGFFPALEGIENVDDRKRAMTLEDLLTMRSGTDYHERGAGSPHFQLNALPRGWTEFVLDRPMETVPGTTYQYDSGGVILMSAILKARTGEHADAFLETHLFEPLGIERSWWFRNEEGHPHTGGGLSLRSRDMAKFGLLYLHQGRWEGKQVVPAAWVEASTKRHVTFAKVRRGMTGYGYLWWVMPPDPQGDGKTEIYAACGFRAQYIFVVPEHSLVVVVTGATRSGADQNRPREFLYSHILAAVKR
jgi:CubicO group peptidase (beta-lactamase class C family)